MFKRLMSQSYENVEGNINKMLIIDIFEKIINSQNKNIINLIG